MEIGAFFMLVLLVIVLAIVGGGVWAIAGKLRRGQLDPQEDRTEPADDPERRPTHRRVSSEQRTEFVHPR